jgi:hypothetical protein
MTLLVVLLATGNKVGLASGSLDVLHTDVDALADDAVAHLLVHLNTNSTRSNVPNTTSLTVVVLVGHTLVNLTGALDIDNITELEVNHVGGQMGGSMFAKGHGEHMTSARAQTKRVWHCIPLVSYPTTTAKKVPVQQTANASITKHNYTRKYGCIRRIGMFCVPLG